MTLTVNSKQTKTSQYLLQGTLNNTANGSNQTGFKFSSIKSQSILFCFTKIK